MAHPILTTKLYIPPPRPGLVSRPRLIERLNEGLQRKLILISAPAGFGKSTLLIDWVHQSKLPVAWISLDRGENDLVGFLAYCVAALQTIEPGIGETVQAMSQAPQPPPIEIVLTALINDIAALRQDFILVLDDYHVIEAIQIHETLAFILEHMPPQMLLVIASRSDPFLPLSRLRSKGQLTELRAENLRFTSGEASAFLNQAMGLGLSSEEVATLETRTEGWIAGLRLAAVSLLERMQSGEDLPPFIAAFSGDDRFIVDYLVDEVMAQLPQETKEFLLRTSILDRLSGPLCDAVTGQEDGQKVLERLERTNLFTMSLDNRRRWYRYHHLFADLLEQRLKEIGTPHEIKSLHQRASRWFEENDFLVEAVEHALAAQDHEDVIRLIYEGIEGIFQRSELNLLLKWRAALPDELVAAEPKLGIILAWAWIATGHPQEAETQIQTLEDALGARVKDLFQNPESLDTMTRSALFEVAVMRAQLAIGRGELEIAQSLASQILPSLEENDKPFIHNPPAELRTVLFFIMGLVAKVNGNLQRASDALSTAVALAQTHRNVHLFAAASGHLANVQTLQGDLIQADSTCRHGMEILEEIARRSSPLVSQLRAESGSLAYERNDLEAAQSQFQEAISLAKPWEYWEGLMPAYLGLARLRVAQKDWQAAWAAVDELQTLSQKYAHLAPAVASARAVLLIAQGKTEAARSWVQPVELDQADELDRTLEGNALILVRWHIMKANWRQAGGLIDRMLELAQNDGRLGREIELLALKAVVYQALDQPEGSLNALSHALELAEPQGYVRTFVDAGQPMKQLLRLAVERGVALEYARTLLSAFPEPESVGTKPAAIPPQAPSQEMVEPLSERELEVLALISRGYSNKQIANQLYLSMGTIKVHAHNIYGKLGVNNRTQAVARATELGVLPIE